MTTRPNEVTGANAGKRPGLPFVIAPTWLSSGVRPFSSVESQSESPVGAKDNSPGQAKRRPGKRSKK